MKTGTARPGSPGDSAETKQVEQIVAQVRASLPFHPGRHALIENAKAMSLQVCLSMSSRWRTPAS